MTDRFRPDAAVRRIVPQTVGPAPSPAIWNSEMNKDRTAREDKRLDPDFHRLGFAGREDAEGRN